MKCYILMRTHEIRFAKVAPSDLIMIYESDSGHAQPMAAIRSVRSVDKIRM